MKDKTVNAICLNCHIGSKAHVTVGQIGSDCSGGPVVHRETGRRTSLTFERGGLIRVVKCYRCTPSGNPVFLIDGCITNGGVSRCTGRFLGNGSEIRGVYGTIFRILSTLSCIRSENMVRESVGPSGVVIRDSSGVELVSLNVTEVGSKGGFSRCNFVKAPRCTTPRRVLESGAHAIRVGTTASLCTLNVAFCRVLAKKGPFSTSARISALAQRVERALPSRSTVPGHIVGMVSGTARGRRSGEFRATRRFEDTLGSTLLPRESVFRQFGR